MGEKLIAEMSLQEIIYEYWKTNNLPTNELRDVFTSLIERAESYSNTIEHAENIEDLWSIHDTLVEEMRKETYWLSEFRNALLHLELHCREVKYSVEEINIINNSRSFDIQEICSSTWQDLKIRNKEYISKIGTRANEEKHDRDLLRGFSRRKLYVKLSSVLLDLAIGFFLLTFGYSAIVSNITNSWYYFFATLLAYLIKKYIVVEKVRKWLFRREKSYLCSAINKALIFLVRYKLDVIEERKATLDLINELKTIHIAKWRTEAATADNSESE